MADLYHSVTATSDGRGMILADLSVTATSDGRGMILADLSVTATSDSTNTWTIVYASRAPLTPEQIEANRLAEAQREAEYQAREKQRQTAIKTAEELLLANLTPDQRRSLEQMKSFVLKSEHGRIYRIRRGAHNVDELDDTGKALRKFCIVPSAMDIPEADKILAQKLMLEYAEDLFLRTANAQRLP